MDNVYLALILSVEADWKKNKLVGGFSFISNQWVGIYCISFLINSLGENSI